MRFAYDIDEPALERALEDWRCKMGIKHRPRYAFTDIVSSVCVHGFFRPVILMPEGILERVSVKDAALMGAHEMAHIKRGDTFLFAFSTALKAIFWFNPFMQSIAARATLAAEQSADALVIQAGAARRDYAHCFVQGLRYAAGTRFAGHDLVPTFTAFDKRSRRARLDAILSGRTDDTRLSASQKIAIGLTTIAAAAFGLAQAALAVAPQPPKDALPQSPVDGRISLGFGEQARSIGKKRSFHEGVDIVAPHGTFVRAAGDGKVTHATARYQGVTAWGNVVVIDHGHGLLTRYAHLDFYKVKKGDRVSAGQVIGAVGSTGKSTGPHLHFEVIQDGSLIDPTPIISADPMPAPSPLPAPEPRAVLKHKNATLTAPSSAPAPKPLKKLAHAKVDSDLARKLEQRLAGGVETLERELKNQFKEFDSYTFTIEPMTLEQLDGVAAIAEAFEDMEFDFEDLQIEIPDTIEIVENLRVLGDMNVLAREELEDIAERARDEAERETRTRATRAGA